MGRRQINSPGIKLSNWALQHAFGGREGFGALQGFGALFEARSPFFLACLITVSNFEGTGLSGRPAIDAQTCGRWCCHSEACTMAFLAQLQAHSNLPYADCEPIAEAHKTTCILCATLSWRVGWACLGNSMRCMDIPHPSSLHVQQYNPGSSHPSQPGHMTKKFVCTREWNQALDSRQGANLMSSAPFCTDLGHFPR